MSLSSTGRPDRQNPEFLFIFLFPQHLCNLYSLQGAFGWLGTASVFVFGSSLAFRYIFILFLLLLLLADAVCIKFINRPNVPLFSFPHFSVSPLCLFSPTSLLASIRARCVVEVDGLVFHLSCRYRVSLMIGYLVW